MSDSHPAKQQHEMVRLFRLSATHVGGIALDKQTTFLMDADGNVVGASRAYFLSTPGSPEVCQPSTPLAYKNVAVYKVPAGGSFNLATWTGSGGAAYAVSAVHGVMQSTQPGGKLY